MKKEKIETVWDETDTLQIPNNIEKEKKQLNSLGEKLRSFFASKKKNEVQKDKTNLEKIELILKAPLWKFHLKENKIEKLYLDSLRKNPEEAIEIENKIKECPYVNSIIIDYAKENIDKEKCYYSFVTDAEPNIKCVSDIHQFRQKEIDQYLSGGMTYRERFLFEDNMKGNIHLKKAVNETQVERAITMTDLMSIQKPKPRNLYEKGQELLFQKEVPAKLKQLKLVSKAIGKEFFHKMNDIETLDFYLNLKSKSGFRDTSLSTAYLAGSSSILIDAIKANSPNLEEIKEKIASSTNIPNKEIFMEKAKERALKEDIEFLMKKYEDISERPGLIQKKEFIETKNATIQNQIEQIVPLQKSNEKKDLNQTQKEEKKEVSKKNKSTKRQRNLKSKQKITSK